ncbi:hypothetical protein DdX_13923 [Ditylenchus destructor]|uniref:Transmembrane protein n=1 Tax=Ditylenchus destructor TaxID=166010 RepID=A0AAD4R268_9BILA|nr:hypothetical protein DdX_13923 [Ditylenchus destructor]
MAKFGTLILLLFILSVVINGIAAQCNCSIEVEKFNQKYTEKSCSNWHSYVQCMKKCNKSDAEIKKGFEDVPEQCGMSNSSPEKSMSALMTVVVSCVGYYVVNFL